MSTELISQNGRRGRVSNGDGLIRFTLCPLDLHFAPKKSGTSKFSMHIYIYESHLRLTFLLIKEASKPEVEGFGVGRVGGKFGEELRKNAKEHTIQDEVHASLVSSADGIGCKEGEVGISQMDGGAEEMSEGAAMCGVDESTLAGCAETKPGVMEMEVEEGDSRSKNEGDGGDDAGNDKDEMETESERHHIEDFDGEGPTEGLGENNVLDETIKNGRRREPQSMKSLFMDIGRLSKPDLSAASDTRYLLSYFLVSALCWTLTVVELEMCSRGISTPIIINAHMFTGCGRSKNT